jgi:hypothetical protein
MSPVDENFAVYQWYHLAIGSVLVFLNAPLNGSYHGLAGRGPVVCNRITLLSPRDENFAVYQRNNRDFELVRKGDSHWSSINLIQLECRQRLVSSDSGRNVGLIRNHHSNISQLFHHWGRPCASLIVYEVY